MALPPVPSWVNEFKAFIARGSVGEGGAYEARSVVVGVNGVTPPM